MDKMKTLTVNGKTYEICDPSAPRIDNETVGDSLWSSKKIAQEISKVDHSSAIVCDASGEVISVTDASNRGLQGLTLYGKTTQDGTPTPDAPVDLVSVGDGGSVGVTVAGENKEPQTLTASTPNGLNGLPMPNTVSDGFTYTHDYIDADGKAWITDYVDFARGVRVQRFKTVTTTQAYRLINVKNGFGQFIVKLPADRKLGSYCLCSHYYVPIDSDLTLYNNPTYTGVLYKRISGNPVEMFIAHEGITTLEDYNAWLKENQPVFLYELAEPIETPLSAEELAQYAALHTNKPNTTVYNDGGAGMALTYVADTKTYIDNKFTALQNAILATGANI